MVDFRKISVLTFVIVIFGTYLAHSQVNWINFKQLDDSLKLKSKKVFIDFYADWCANCKKMDKAVYRDSDVVAELNKNYYCVKMNAESKEEIQFGGRYFRNTQVKSKRHPTHDIALAFGSRYGQEFSLPLVVILNNKFEVVGRYFEYISPKKMKSILKI